MTEDTSPEKTVSTDDKKTKIAAAIAKAKNKAIAKANVETIIEKKVEVNETSVLTSTDNSIKTDSKPSKPEKIEQENTAESESKPVAAIDKKAKIAAAIAKAKAKKKLKEASTVEENDQDGV